MTEKINKWILEIISRSVQWAAEGPAGWFREEKFWNQPWCFRLSSDTHTVTHTQCTEAGSAPSLLKTSRPNEDNRQSHKITRWPRRFPRGPSTAGCRPFWKTGIMWSGRRGPQTLSERLRSIWTRLVFLIVLFLNEMAADGSTQRLLQQTHYKKNFMYNLEILDNNPLIIRSSSLEMFYVEHILVPYSDYMWQAQVFLWNRILKNVWRHKTSRKLYTQI